MSLALFPNDCCALIVEAEPVHAMALDLLLGEFGCRCLGPAFSFETTELFVSKRRPSFALIDVDLGDELVPVAECLARREVPFAFMEFGDASHILDRSPVTRDRPRISRPFHAPVLHAAAAALYQQSLRAAITSADHRIADGRQRLADQLTLIERMAAAGQDTMSADAKARECGRLLQTARTTRRLLARRLDCFTELLLLPQRWGTGTSNGADEGRSAQRERFTQS